MKTVEDDIWMYLDTHWVTVTTNLGWKTTGENIMGRGLAQQAALRFMDLPKIYGAICRANPGAAEVHPVTFTDKFDQVIGRLVMYPTKPLNVKIPWLSWKQGSDLELIEKCSESLKEFADTTNIPIAIPLFGCQNGGLNPIDMEERINGWFGSDDRFLLVKPKAKRETDDLPF